MATVGTLAYTYTDWAKRLDPDGKVDAIVEILTDENAILEDAMVVEGNGPTAHRTTVRAGLPTVTWRQLNYGVPKSKSLVTQVDDTFGMLESYAEIDKDLADLNGNSAEFRLSEDKAFLEAMNQELASTLIYGNTATDPKKFMGLAPRYNSISTDRRKSGYNIIDAGGTGTDNSSIWLITWGDQTCHMTFPKGKIAGFQHNDLGQETLTDSAGGLYEGYRTHYKWDVGFVLRDWRFCARIANIDISALATYGSGSDTSAKIIHFMIEAMHRIPNMKRGKSVFYVNETVMTWLDIMAQDKHNVYLTSKEFAGEMVTMFRGIPVKKVDAILDTEARVT